MSWDKSEPRSLSDGGSRLEGFGERGPLREWGAPTHPFPPKWRFAFELIHRPKGLGWTGQAQEFQRSQRFRSEWSWAIVAGRAAGCAFSVH